MKVEFDSELFARYKYNSIDDIPVTMLADLDYIINGLPNGVSYSITAHGKTYDHIDEYVEERIEDFFDVPDDMYKDLVGKYFINEDKTVIIKVVGLTDDIREFLYEQYEKRNDGMWEPQDYIYLQESTRGEYAKEDLKKYCLTDQTEINACAEGMFMLGKDGKLYIDYSCGNNFYVFSETKNSLFELIKAEALLTLNDE